MHGDILPVSRRRQRVLVISFGNPGAKCLSHGLQQLHRYLIYDVHRAASNFKSNYITKSAFYKCYKYIPTYRYIYANYQ